MALRTGIFYALRSLRHRSQAPHVTFSSSPTVDDLLASPVLQSLLSEHKTTATTSQSSSPGTRVSLLAHFATETGLPVSSNVAPKLLSATDMAEWYARACRPSAARPHARGLISSTLGGDDLDDRIDRHRDEVQMEFEEKVPGNLQLDTNTFRRPRQRKSRGWHKKRVTNSGSG